MKIKIEVDCTPDEARKFLGLPEVSQLQERLLLETEERMRQWLSETDASQLIKLWLPQSFSGVDKMMQMWAQFGAQSNDERKS